MNPYICREGVILIEIHGVFLLISDKEARSHCAYLREINELGAFIWKQLENGCDESSITKSICEEFDLPEGYDLSHDVRTFLDELEKNHYIIPTFKESMIDGDCHKEQERRHLDNEI